MSHTSGTPMPVSGHTTDSACPHARPELAADTGRAGRALKLYRHLHAAITAAAITQEPA